MQNQQVLAGGHECGGVRHECRFQIDVVALVTAIFDPKVWDESVSLTHGVERRSQWVCEPCMPVSAFAARRRPVLG